MTAPAAHAHPSAAHPSARRPPRAVTWRDVGTPVWIVGFARHLGVFALLLLLALALVPWPQAAPANGVVTVMDPRGRDQTLDAPIDGFVAVWSVVEGDTVKAGDPLVALRDNDAARLDRLQAQRDTLLARIEAAHAKQAASQQKVIAAEHARDAAIAAAKADLAAAAREVEAARASLRAAEAKASVAGIQGDRARILAEQGLTSDQDAETKGLSADTARADLAAARAKVVAAEAKRDAAAAKVDAVGRKGDGDIAEAEGQRLEAVAKVADLDASLLALDGTIAAQAAQDLKAPFDGRVVRLFGGAVGEQVKKGDPLVRLVPDHDERVVELQIDGLNASLVQPGQEVRIQFEGWPALQFAGWPQVAPGTFGGRIRLVDPVADVTGKVRLIAEPDPASGEGQAWPPPERLPQGLRATAWVILGEVPLGYEVWRRLNDFPPTVAAPKDKGTPTLPIDASKARKAWSSK